MDKRIVWSIRAKEDRREILEYWIKANGNSRYSLKLRKEFNQLIRFLKDFPNLGKRVYNYDARCLVKGDYKIFYDLNEDYNNLEIIVLHIWDSRRNPENFNLLD
ncbi:MAG: type II toxin-antitoxin system RelE/ParE family toxin [Ignavibacteria bacterium]|nr:type II toxin-antitoxin system RelE/ParE family toxin [Ignavibacteria bacterium]